jgi:hypothetical protein
MTTVTFIPANSFYRNDGRGRQLHFSQKLDGTVEVRVSTADLKSINTVYQDSIFVQPKSTEHGLPEVQKLEDMTQEERKALIRGIEANTVEVLPENGGISGVKKPNTVKTVFFHKIRSLTLSEK